MNNGKLFWWRVAEITEWCNSHVLTDLQHGLRNAEFGTPYLIDSCAFLKGGFDEWCGLSVHDKARLQAKAEQHRGSLVDALSDHRAQILVEANNYPSIGGEQLVGQRFIVYLPETNLADGAAALVSHGYFDDDNVPPWDTWVVYIPADAGEPGKLISWVPPQLFKLVDDAIQVNPEECIYWATERELFPVSNL